VSTQQPVHGRRRSTGPRVLRVRRRGRDRHRQPRELPGPESLLRARSATREGARALALDADYGTIEPGKRARLLAVALPPRVGDVEEYLVSGVEPGQLRWIR
jgi:hypothetical protein